MFKKIVALLFCGMLSLSTAACADESSHDTDKSTVSVTASAPVAKIDTIVINGQELSLFSQVTDDLITALGTPANTQKALSCHYDGEDTIYTYAGFVLYTYAHDESEILYLIEIKDSSIETSEGISIGSSYDDVIAAYGTPDDESVLFAKFIVSDTTAIRFEFDESRNVTGIEYSEI